MWISIKEKPENKDGLFVVLSEINSFAGKVPGVQLAEYQDDILVDAYNLQPIEQENIEILYYFRIPDIPEGNARRFESIKRSKINQLFDPDLDSLDRSRKLINENHPCRKVK